MIAKGDRVLIEWQGRTVTVVSGAAGAALAEQLQRADADRTQQLLAQPPATSSAETNAE